MSSTLEIVEHVTDLGTEGGVEYAEYQKQNCLCIVYSTVSKIIGSNFISCSKPYNAS